MPKIIAPSGGGAGGGGAPTTADYLVRTADAGLSAERVVTDTATVTWDWSVAGQAKANAAGGGGATDTVVILASDVVHTTNSTTLENITGMDFSTTGGANELWRVEYWLIMDMNSVGGSNADHKIGWSVSGGQTGLWGSNPETGQTSSTQLFSATFAQTLVFGSVSNASGRMLLHLRVLAHANGVSGAIMPRFAQNSSGAGAVATVKADSHYIARKIRS